MKHQGHEEVKQCSYFCKARYLTGQFGGALHNFTDFK